jgi:hypothetical protein
MKNAFAIGLITLLLTACSDKKEEVTPVDDTAVNECVDTGGIPQDTGEGSPCDTEADTAETVVE